MEREGVYEAVVLLLMLVLVSYMGVARARLEKLDCRRAARKSVVVWVEESILKYWICVMTWEGNVKCFEAIVTLTRRKVAIE